MAYRVVLADSAKADASAIYDQLPWRCPLAREAEKARREIRCLLFGKRRNVYRILYETDEPRNTVWVLHIRHGSRKDIEPGRLRLRNTSKK